ncbi:glycosyl hydrolase [Maribacter sp. 2307ULW6-5]|uniref:glycosyl hydrolase n=1 Tax=Maribacter sp. 2307ULW6-5 TaxID=3386275 RepID=UPI0039BC35CA
MKNTGKTKMALSFFMLLTGLTSLSCVSQRLDLPKALIADFKNPPAAYKPMPFWHINGELTTNGIRQQMKDAKELGGFSGISVLPLAPKKNGRPGTTPKFLSGEYLERFQDVLDTAEELDMEVILYDDNDFPSGMAGGQLGELYPQHTMKRLDKIEHMVRGPRQIRQKLPDGQVLSIVAMNTETLERIELTPFINNNVLNYDLPAGSWKVMSFVLVKDSYHKAYPVVDYLDTTAVRKLMELTYGVHQKNFGDYFGTTIKKVFFDDVGFWKHPRTWTGRFNEKFKELNGYDPKPWYPALWYDIGPQTESVRHAFFKTRAELLAEGFPKLVGEWAKANGLKDTGHPPGNYDPTPIDMNADIFKFYRHMAMPLTDAIIGYQFGQNGHKLISSAADYYDKPVVSTEIYGAYKEKTFDSLMLYRSAMDLFSRGVNFVVPHGLWYNPEQVYISPLVSPYSEKLAPALPEYSEFVGRACMLLQGGKRVSEIGVFYPFEELAGWYRFEDPANPRQGFFISPETNYMEISGLLTNDIRQDFTFIHPEFFLEDKYAIQNGAVTLSNLENKQTYKALILTGCKVISAKTLEKLKAYYDQGGLVISTGQLPYKSSEMGKDEQVKTLIKQMFGVDANAPLDGNPHINQNNSGGRAIHLPDANEAELSKALAVGPTPDVAFSPNPTLASDFGKFNYIHKIKEGRHIYFFSNSSDEDIETQVTLKGDVTLFEANPHTGQISPLTNTTKGTLHNQVLTKAKLTLPAVSAVFWISNEMPK